MNKLIAFEIRIAEEVSSKQRLFSYASSNMAQAIGSFTDAMADLLRLYVLFPEVLIALGRMFLTMLAGSPDEALAMTYVYIHKYERFTRSQDSLEMLDPHVRPTIGLELSKIFQSSSRYKSAETTLNPSRPYHWRPFR